MQLDAIGIACKDVQETIKFYNLFGIEFKKLGEDHFEGLTQRGLRIMLDSYELLEKINENWKRPNVSGITLCFLQESSQDVDELYNKIIAAGFTSEKSPWDAFWGQRYSSVKDPNGNQIDIFASL